MLKNIGRLTTRNDVLASLITLLVGGLAIGLVFAAGRIPGVKTIGCLVVGVIVLMIFASRALRLAARYRRIKRGRCPHPGCRGVVQRSERLGDGWVVCPTCKETWPEIEGMTFRLTSRT